MEVHVQLDEKGYIPDAYAKYADEAGMYAGTPTRSFPFTLSDVPDGTKSLALIFFDVDSTPVCGFPWIHWCACNIPGYARKIPENASNLQSLDMVQGRNSSASRLVGSHDKLVTCRYNGPQPPDKDHVYTLVVFALDYAPQLKEGFWANELLHAAEGHTLARAVAQLPARV
ncbi:MAG: YbhB/YbcL family Raf kinase inhibitor-like protein [Tractidigestivibacter sp.]|jgi:Raf kinase inhibitor-like YbhB/YbcL family protein|uniref:YbhB/YbcL family Raf kinase inhibitor-like protein n=1 Tax=Tractidigestivibacter sp. TaxID=2847320 RepID=UPI003D949DE0